MANEPLQKSPFFLSVSLERDVHQKISPNHINLRRIIGSEKIKQLRNILPSVSTEHY